MIFNLFSFCCLFIYYSVILGYGPVTQTTVTTSTATSACPSTAVSAAPSEHQLAATALTQAERKATAPGGSSRGHDDLGPGQQQQPQSNSPPSLFFLSMLAVQWHCQYNINDILERQCNN